MFKVGSKIIYKGDVCVVKEIKLQYFHDTDYYFLSPMSDLSLTIKIPVDSSSSDIRDVISKDDALKLIYSIPNVPVIDALNEKNMENNYKELIKGRTYKGLIQVIKTTYLRNQTRLDNNKKTSEKDTTYLKKAEDKLYDELAVALDIPITDVKSKIVAICQKES